MSGSVERAEGLFRALCYEIWSENLTFMAGSLAYHSFVSVLPLLLLALAVISSVGDATLESGLIDLTGRTLTPGVGELLTAELRRASTSAGVSVVGGLFLLWGTLRIFRGLDTAFSVIYQTESKNTLSDQFVDGLLVLAVSGASLGVVAGVEAAVAGATGGPVGWVAQRAVLLVGLTLVFVPMYYVFPDQPEMDVVEVLPGALVATLGMLVLQALLGLYFSIESVAPRQSVIVAFLVFLTLLYMGNLVVLVGAAVNVVTANRTREVDVRPLFSGLPRTASRPAERSALVANLERVERRLETRDTLTLDDGETTITLAGPDVVRLDTGDGRPFAGSGPVRLECHWFPEGDRRH